jgi:hypothetical protein
MISTGLLGQAISHQNSQNYMYVILLNHRCPSGTRDAGMGPRHGITCLISLSFYICFYLTYCLVFEL